MHPKSCKIRPENSHYSFALRKRKQSKKKIRRPISDIQSNSMDIEDVRSVRDMFSSPRSIVGSYYNEGSDLFNSRLNLLFNNN
jgi:hypothetical protein